VTHILTSRTSHKFHDPHAGNSAEHSTVKVVFQPVKKSAKHRSGPNLNKNRNKRNKKETIDTTSTERKAEMSVGVINTDGNVWVHSQTSTEKNVITSAELCTHLTPDSLSSSHPPYPSVCQQFNSGTRLLQVKKLPQTKKKKPHGNGAAGLSTCRDNEHGASDDDAELRD